jgi:hypothetical protein
MEHTNGGNKMIQTNSKYPETVRKVGFFPPNNPKHTSIEFGKKVKDSEPVLYENYKLIMWNELLDVKEGDKITFKSIDQVSLSQYNGKISINISAKITLQKADAPQYDTEESYVTADDDDFLPPFDVG